MAEEAYIDIILFKSFNCGSRKGYRTHLALETFTGSKYYKPSKRDKAGQYISFYPEGHVGCKTKGSHFHDKEYDIQHSRPVDVKRIRLIVSKDATEKIQSIFIELFQEIENGRFKWGFWDNCSYFIVELLGRAGIKSVYFSWLDYFSIAFASVLLARSINPFVYYLLSIDQVLHNGEFRILNRPLFQLGAWRGFFFPFGIVGACSTVGSVLTLKIILLKWYKYRYKDSFQSFSWEDFCKIALLALPIQSSPAYVMISFLYIVNNVIDPLIWFVLVKSKIFRVLVVSVLDLMYPSEESRKLKDYSDLASAFLMGILSPEWLQSFYANFRIHESTSPYIFTGWVYNFYGAFGLTFFLISIGVSSIFDYVFGSLPTPHFIFYGLSCYSLEQRSSCISSSYTKFLQRFPFPCISSVNNVSIASSNFQENKKTFSLMNSTYLLGDKTWVVSLVTTKKDKTRKDVAHLAGHSVIVIEGEEYDDAKKIFIKFAGIYEIKVDSELCRVLMYKDGVMPDIENVGMPYITEVCTEQHLESDGDSYATVMDKLNRFKYLPRKTAYASKEACFNMLSSIFADKAKTVSALQHLPGLTRVVYKDLKDYDVQSYAKGIQFARDNLLKYQRIGNHSLLSQGDADNCCTWALDKLAQAGLNEGAYSLELISAVAPSSHTSRCKGLLNSIWSYVS